MLSVILPCFNEAKGLLSIVQRYADSRGEVDIELILVDNGSKDETPSVMRQLAQEFSFVRPFRVVNNKGYGDGILQGLRQASGEWLAWSHADLQTDPADVLRAFCTLQAARDPRRTLVKGCRSGRAMSERIITWGMQMVALVLLRRRFHEINAQPKIFHRDLLAEMVAPPVDFNFDVYVLYQARRAGWRLATIPVQFPPRQYGHSNWSKTWGSKSRTIWRSLWFMVKLGGGLWHGSNQK